MQRHVAVVVVALLACAGTPTSSQHPTDEASPAPVRSLDHCQLAHQPLSPLDVAIAIDISASTLDASGFDVDSDGVVGELAANQIFPRSTDPGDSLLAAQVSAAKDLVSELSNDETRFSVIAYSGATPTRPERRTTDSLVVSELSSDPVTLRHAIDGVLAHGSKGGLVFSAGMNGALETLTASPSAGASRKVALFMSAQAYPIILGVTRGKRADPRMQEAAQGAIDAAVRFHTFGLGEAASTPEPHTLSRIAGATDGVYRPVADTSQLSCLLAAALTP
jgi:hypothetical protein